MSSKIIERAYRTYALYTLEDRALLYIQDGLRASIRRALWTSRNQPKQKTSGLSGAMTILHPHGDASEVIQNFTSMFKNNIPYFDGNDAGFGTLLEPSNYSAARYTSVKRSNFTNDAILVDLDIVPMKKNYDETCEEPLYLLPLVPLHFINSITGMAIGYKCTTVSYKLADVINAQISVLNNQPIDALVPFFVPLQQSATLKNVTVGGNEVWNFSGQVKQLSKTKWQITSLPYGLQHSSFVKHLQNLYQDGLIVNIDDGSSDQIDCTITVPRDTSYTPEKMMDLLKLHKTRAECLYFIDVTNQTVEHYTVKSTIEKFTLDRLKFYSIRLAKQNAKLSDDLLFEQMLLITIQLIETKQPALTKMSRKQFEEYLSENGVTNYVSNIVSLPLYRFNKDEIEKVINKIETIQKEIDKNNKTMNSDKLLRRLYERELLEVKKNHA